MDETVVLLLTLHGKHFMMRRDCLQIAHQTESWYVASHAHMS